MIHTISLILFAAQARKRQQKQALINQPQNQNQELIPYSDLGQARDKLGEKLPQAEGKSSVQAGKLFNTI